MKEWIEEFVYDHDKVVTMLKGLADVEKKYNKRYCRMTIDEKRAAVVASATTGLVCRWYGIITPTGERHTDKWREVYAQLVKEAVTNE